MTLKAAFNWDHLAGVNLTPGNTTGGSAFSISQWTELSPIATPSYAFLSTGTINQLTIDNNGWIAVANAGGTAMGALEIPLSAIIDTTKNASWFGARYKATGQQINSSSLAVFGYATSTNGVGYVKLVTTDQLVAWGVVLGKEYYFELQFVKNGANYNLNVYMDGVLRNTVTNAIPVATVATAFFWFGPANTNTATTLAVMSIRDVYYLDEDGLSNWDSTRLGPIRTSPLPYSSISAPNYIVGTAALTGSAALSTARSKFGGSSLLAATAAGDCAIIQDATPLKLTGDFTIEFFFYSLSASTSGVLYSKGGVAASIQLQANKSVVYSDQSTSTPVLNITSGKIIQNQFQHHAIVKQGNTWTYYIDGQSIGSATLAGQTFGNNTGSAYVGNWSGVNSVANGNIDEFRISNVARYTANFTPPSAAFTPDANTVTLLHCDQALAGFMHDDAVSPAAAFQTPQPNGVPAVTPNVTNAATLDPLTVSFSSSAIPAGSKILAVKYQNAVMNQQSGSGVLNGAAVMGGNNVPLTQETFTDATMRYSRSLGILKTAPDGSAWTPANIAATQLVLTPTSV